MKSYNHLYEKTISETNRRYALSQAKHSKRFRKIMKHRHMSDDAAVEQSLDWIVNYENAEHVPVYIYDGITRKERTIIVPTMEELLVQHCIVNAMKPMFCKGMYEHSLSWVDRLHRYLFDVSEVDKTVYQFPAIKAKSFTI